MRLELSVTEPKPPQRARRVLSFRRLVQVTCLSAFLILFFYVCWPYGSRQYAEAFRGREVVDAETFLLLDPLVSLSTAIAAKVLVWCLIPAVGVILFCIVFPRAFCGYVCPLGTLFDGFDWLVGGRVRACVRSSASVGPVKKAGALQGRDSPATHGRDARAATARPLADPLSRLARKQPKERSGPGCGRGLSARFPEIASTMVRCVQAICHGADSLSGARSGDIGSRGRVPARRLSGGRNSRRAAIWPMIDDVTRYISIVTRCSSRQERGRQ
jgi:hypothetical protein